MASVKYCHNDYCDKLVIAKFKSARQTTRNLKLCNSLYLQGCIRPTPSPLHQLDRNSIVCHSFECHSTGLSRRHILQIVTSTNQFMSSRPLTVGVKKKKKKKKKKTRPTLFQTPDSAIFLSVKRKIKK